MKNKRNVLYSLIIMLAGVNYFPVQAQQKNGAQDTVETKDVYTSHAPKGIVRTIKQDRKGNIWITSWEGVFKYDGESFINITRTVSSARFFFVLEDRKGNFWFGSIGSGVYFTMGNPFKISQPGRDFFLMKLEVFMKIKKATSGLVSPEEQAVTMKSFRNYIVDGNGMNDGPQKGLQQL
jgi:hypothetical protein